MDLATFQHILLAIKALPGKGKKKQNMSFFFIVKLKNSRKQVLKRD